jgi:hypothetical protein
MPRRRACCPAALAAALAPRLLPRLPSRFKFPPHMLPRSTPQPCLPPLAAAFA